MPLLSILTAVAPDRADYLLEAGASIPRTLTSNWQVEWEVSVDGPGIDPDILEKVQQNPALGGLSISPQKEGVSCARNRALMACKGDWILNLDGDDQLIGEGVREVARRIQADEGELGRAAGALLKENGEVYPITPENALGVWAKGRLVSEWTVPMVFHPGAAWMRRNLLLAVGGWPALTGIEDKLPIFQVSELADGLITGTGTHQYRSWEGQATKTLAHAESRQHALNFTTRVLTERRKLEDPLAPEVKPVRRTD
jgi:glycosyltransferase involved in cell wall biosynthesis